MGHRFLKMDAGIAVSWIVVQWPANSLINLSAAGMLILLWTEAHNAWKELWCFGMWCKGQPILSLIICGWNADITLNWGSQCLERVVMLWNVVQGPANSFINYLWLECWYYSELRLTMLGKSCNTLECGGWASQFFINLFAPGMLILLWHEAPHDLIRRTIEDESQCHLTLRIVNMIVLDRELSERRSRFFNSKFMPG
jgi:hypothetical protein